LIGLGTVIAATAVLGPFLTGVIRYRTSDTTLNQVIGGDAVALLLIAPACLATGIGLLRGAVWARTPMARVMMLTAPLPASKRAIQAGTRRGGLAPSTRASSSRPRGMDRTGDPASLK
jgi:hypothetical protein